jgi:hypothetical protein
MHSHNPYAQQQAILLNPASCANTAAATGAWVDASQFTGDVVITQHIGAVTGSIVGKIQHADDGSGTNAEDVTGGGFASVSSANNLQKIVLRRQGLKPFIRYLGTITTGPALVEANLTGIKSGYST